MNMYNFNLKTKKKDSSFKPIILVPLEWVTLPSYLSTMQASELVSWLHSYPLSWAIWAAIKKKKYPKLGRNVGTSLAVQWLIIHLPVQGTLIWSLVGQLRSYLPRGNKAHTQQLRSMQATTGAKPKCTMEDPECLMQPKIDKYLKTKEE